MHLFADWFVVNSVKQEMVASVSAALSRISHQFHCFVFISHLAMCPISLSFTWVESKSDKGTSFWALSAVPNNLGLRSCDKVPLNYYSEFFS